MSRNAFVIRDWAICENQIYLECKSLSKEPRDWTIVGMHIVVTYVIRIRQVAIVASDGYIRS